MKNYLLAAKPSKIVYLPIILIGAYFAKLSFAEVSFLDITLLLLFYQVFYSGVYIINDIIDYPNDIKDKYKKRRIIASGKISRKNALIFSIFLLLAGTIGLYNVFVDSLYIMGILLVVNLLYAFEIKNFAYLDTIFISITNPLKFLLGYSFVYKSLNTETIEKALPIFVILYLMAVSGGFIKKHKEIMASQNSRVALKNYTLNGIRRAELILAVPTYWAIFFFDLPYRPVIFFIYSFYLFSIFLYLKNSEAKQLVDKIGDRVIDGIKETDLEKIRNLLGSDKFEKTLDVAINKVLKDKKINLKEPNKVTQYFLILVIVILSIVVFKQNHTINDLNTEISTLENVDN